MELETVIVNISLSTALLAVTFTMLYLFFGK